MVQLTQLQLDHTLNIIKCLNKYKRVIDTSTMGSGKTYCVLHIAKHYKLPIIVVCPKSTISTWKSLAIEFDVEICYQQTYAGLRGKNCELLQRNDDGFTITPYLQQLINSGVIFVMDESQHLKNKSYQYYACCEITRHIQLSSTSKFMMLSGTPFDKPEHCIQMVKLLVFMKQSTFFKYDAQKKSVEYTGLREMILNCKKMNMLKTNSTIESQSIKKNRLSTIKLRSEKLVYDLFIQIIKPELIVCMPTHVIPAILDVQNGYYNISSIEADKLQQCIIKLGSAANSISKRTKKTIIKYDAVMICMHDIETCKLNLFHRLISKQLDLHPTSKVVCFVNFISSITQLKTTLQKYNPLIMSGATSLAHRADIISKFQTPSCEHRLLIANTLVGGTGISLHDLNGDFPRTIFISPTYNILESHQAVYRVYRTGTISDSCVRFVYGNIKSQETSILNALTRKTGVLKDVLDVQVANNIKFPGEYHNIYEK